MILSKTAKLTSKGQVTIPAEVREALGLRAGDALTFEVDERGRAVLKPVRGASPFARFAGILSEGDGTGAAEIVAELRETRGW